MIQEIAPKVLDNTYRPMHPEAEDLVLCYDGEAVAVRRDGMEHLTFPMRREFSASDTHFRYLFSIDEDHYSAERRQGQVHGGSYRIPSL